MSKQGAKIGDHAVPRAGLEVLAQLAITKLQADASQISEES
jgi:hypothetical protein